jgi:tRNA/rRNA methyltransferase
MAAIELNPQQMINYNENITIILVEPQSPGNIGMVCRAMKNMGLSNLRLVKGCSKNHREARKFAVSANDLLEMATIYDSLEDALADQEVTVATTRRHGKYRREILSPGEIARNILSSIGKNRAALVFGREDNGLTTDELALCRWHATIPTSDEYGSLNLAQAVLIFCYELFLGQNSVVSEETRSLATVSEVESLYRHMETTLLDIGFLNTENPAHLMRCLRRIFARSALDSREVTILRGMMSQIDWAASNLPKGGLS